MIYLIIFFFKNSKVVIPNAYKPPPSEYAEPGEESFGKYVDIKFKASFS